MTSYGQLGRMTQFKDKAEQREFVSAGLFTYPVLMAGDILLYQTDIVPIGDDQRQHLELARDVAERFNTRFGETFVVPKGVYPEVGARIMDLQEPTKKMSTTGGTAQGTVRLLDEPDVVRKKFKSAVTDSGREVRYDPDEKPGVSNLIEILSVATGEPITDDRGPRTTAPGTAVQGGRRRGRRRDAEPVQERYRELRADEGELRAAARRRGRQGARSVGADARGDVRADGVRCSLATGDPTKRRHLVARQVAPLPRTEAAEVEARIARTVQAAHRVPDGLAHPAHLPVAPLVENELEA